MFIFNLIKPASSPCVGKCVICISQFSNSLSLSIAFFAVGFGWQTVFPIHLKEFTCGGGYIKISDNFSLEISYYMNPGKLYQLSKDIIFNYTINNDKEKDKTDRSADSRDHYGLKDELP